ncbi:hypothetical protein AQUCO_10900002v1 [Aquilegia coerulea]|uniref:CL1 n=1 Tax=Aquilegia coerulea TaxID=218851 RepID=A0A2G5C324_AQUCA|nr:hypothetical protein AQUCO_10900002v1 [Aquilegia coerulea]
MWKIVRPILANDAYSLQKYGVKLGGPMSGAVKCRLYCSSPHDIRLIFPKKVVVAVFAEGDSAVAARAAGADFVGGDDLIERIKLGGNSFKFNMCIATPTIMPRLEEIRVKLENRGMMPNPLLGSVTENLTVAITKAKAGEVTYKIKVPPQPKVVITEDMLIKSKELKGEMEKHIATHWDNGKIIELKEELEKLGQGVGLEIVADVDGGLKNLKAMLGAFLYTREGIDIGALMASTDYKDNNEFELHALVTVLVILDIIDRVVGTSFVLDIISDNRQNIKCIKGKPINAKRSLKYIYLVLVGRELIRRPWVNKLRVVKRNLNMVADHLSHETTYSAIQFIPRNAYTKRLQKYVEGKLKLREWEKVLEESSSESDKDAAKRSDKDNNPY